MSRSSNVNPLPGARTPAGLPACRKLCPPLVAPWLLPLCPLAAVLLLHHTSRCRMLCHAAQVRGPARTAKDARKQAQKYAAAKEARSMLGEAGQQAEGLSAGCYAVLPSVGTACAAALLPHPLCCHCTTLPCFCMQSNTVLV